MNRNTRSVFLIVLDSFGIGAMPDAEKFGDGDCSTIRSVSSSPKFSIPNLEKLGLGNIEGVTGVSPTEEPLAAFGRMAEASMGKDTIIGHWEMAGIVTPEPLPVYPDGFPAEIIKRIEEVTGRKVICNKPYSGTDVIRDYGREHIESGALIVYTSADSVCQIAAHEDVIPVEELYRYCEGVRTILRGPHAVGRVIARPFVGTDGKFTRTAHRRDFSLVPSKKTLLDAIVENEKEVISIGKICDIFAGRGITKAIHTHSNEEGMTAIEKMVVGGVRGLCFANLVEFDSLYGHRQDIDGYAAALSAFDKRLPAILNELREDDILIITADHGCDPGDDHTDHTREYVPLLVYGKNIAPYSLGTRETFSDLAVSIAEYLGIDFECEGKSFISDFRSVMPRG